MRTWLRPGLTPARLAGEIAARAAPSHYIVGTGRRANSASATGVRDPEVEARRPASRSRAARRTSGSAAANFSRYRRRFSTHVRLVAPGRRARGLHRRAHRAAVIGPVEQEALEDAPRLPATNPERMPGTFERFDRLENTTSAPEVAADRAAARPPARRAAAALRRSRAPNSTRRRRSRSRAGRTARTARAHSSSVITRPVGFPGEQTYRSCTRGHTALGTDS